MVVDLLLRYGDDDDDDILHYILLWIGLLSALAFLQLWHAKEVVTQNKKQNEILFLDVEIKCLSIFFLF